MCVNSNLEVDPSFNAGIDVDVVDGVDGDISNLGKTTALMISLTTFVSLYIFWSSTVFARSVSSGTVFGLI